MNTDIEDFITKNNLGPDDYNNFMPLWDIQA